MAIAFSLAFALFSIPALAAGNVSVTIDGEAVVFADQAPVIVDGRTLVPVAAVFHAIDFVSQWDAETRQVTLTRGQDEVIIVIDNNVFTTNAVSHTLDVPAQIIGGSTMLPIRAVLESVGYNLTWDEATRTVIIITN